MSLVSEALRKARQEAAERDAIERGAPPPVVVDRDRPQRHGATGPAAAGVALGLTMAAVAWWLLARPAVTPGPTTAETGIAAVASPAPEVAPPRPATTDESPPAATVPEAPTAAPRTAPAAAAVPTTAARDRTAGTRAAAPGPADVPAAAPPTSARPEPAGTPAAATAPVATAAAAATAADGERSFVLDADLGYATLHLDYIVFKPSAPFGSINGQRIVEGTIVDGFLVEEIGRDFVRLRDSRGPLVLRVR